MNAKTQRIGVCNACESLLVHNSVKDQFLPVLAQRLKEKNVEMRADEEALALMPELFPPQKKTGERNTWITYSPLKWCIL